MNVPKVEKVGDKIVITLEERHAEVMALFLGTFSPCSVYNTIQKYYSRFPNGYPPLCEPPKGVDKPGWQTQDTAVLGNIHFGLTEALRWEYKYDCDRSKEPEE